MAIALTVTELQAGVAPQQVNVVVVEVTAGVASVDAVAGAVSWNAPDPGYSVSSGTIDFYYTIDGTEYLLREASFPSSGTDTVPVPGLISGVRAAGVFSYNDGESDLTIGGSATIDSAGSNAVLPVHEVQSLTPSGAPSEGFTHIQHGSSSCPAWNAPLTVEGLQASLDDSLYGFGPGVVTASETGGVFFITWDAPGPQALLTSPDWDGSINSLVVVAVSAKQKLAFASSPISGGGSNVWTITSGADYINTPTSDLAWNADTAAIQAAMEVIYGSGSVRVTASLSDLAFVVEWIGSLASTPINLLSADGSGLTGASSGGGVFSPIGSSIIHGVDA